MNTLAALFALPLIGAQVRGLFESCKELRNRPLGLIREIDLSQEVTHLSMEDCDMGSVVGPWRPGDLTTTSRAAEGTKLDADVFVHEIQIDDTLAVEAVRENRLGSENELLDVLEKVQAECFDSHHAEQGIR